MCTAAVNSFGYDFDYSSWDKNLHRGNRKRSFQSCSMHPRVDFSINHLPESLDFINDYLVSSDLRACHTLQTNCRCSLRTPCFCIATNFVEHPSSKVSVGNNRRSLQQEDGQFKVTWTLSLGGQESLLESAFLRAGFQQSVKDYINNDILCSSDLTVKGAEFFGVEVALESSEDSTGKKKAVSGNGKCKGDVSKCKVPIKAKKKIVEDDDVFDDGSGRREVRVPDASRVVKATHSRDEFCEIFLSSSIFDAFEERLLTASTFSYNVDVDVLNDLMGNLDLKYDVSFEPAKGNGLNQVEDVDGNPQDPIPINVACDDSQCGSQKNVIKAIFNHFGVPFDENKHECLNQGINCNSADMVTHIWMGEYYDNQNGGLKKNQLIFGS